MIKLYEYIALFPSIQSHDERIEDALGRVNGLAKIQKWKTPVRVQFIKLGSSEDGNIVYNVIYMGQIE